MVRGYQRRVIHLKRTGSRLFDEAYFFVSPDAERASEGKEDLVREANRIIDESIESERYERLSRFGRILHRIRNSIIPFILGALIVGLIWFLTTIV